MRSRWKGPVLNQFFLNKIINKKKKQNKLKINSVIYDKSLVVLTEYINYVFKIYNGFKVQEILITPEMVGLKLGQFIITRKKHIYGRRKKKVNK
jgi:ribosomal protein S19